MLPRFVTDVRCSGGGLGALSLVFEHDRILANLLAVLEGSVVVVLDVHVFHLVDRVVDHNTRLVPALRH